MKQTKLPSQLFMNPWSWLIFPVRPQHGSVGDFALWPFQIQQKVALVQRLQSPNPKWHIATWRRPSKMQSYKIIYDEVMLWIWIWHHLKSILNCLAAKKVQWTKGLKVAFRQRSHWHCQSHRSLHTKPQVQKEHSQKHLCILPTSILFMYSIMPKYL